MYKTVKSLINVTFDSDLTSTSTTYPMETCVRLVFKKYFKNPMKNFVTNQKLEFSKIKKFS